MNYRMFGALRSSGFILATLSMLPGWAQAAEPKPSRSCLDEPLRLQNSANFTLGETYYLPAARQAPECPQQIEWQLVSRPTSSHNQIYPGPQNHARFTPDQPGLYQFEAQVEPPLTVRLQAIQRSTEERFINHYLPPYNGVALVGGELWTANGASYTVSRLHQDPDNGTWQKRDELQVGSWPAAITGRNDLPYVLVAQRGSDTVGFINRVTMRLEDAVWVGDEPTDLVLHPTQKKLYVTSPTMRKIAVVDLEHRQLERTIELGFDPRSLTISSDGALLFVASYRSGNKQADLKGTYGDKDDEDLWIIDTATLSVKRSVSGLSSLNRDLYYDASNQMLWLAGTNGDPIISQAEYAPEQGVLPFVHELLGIDVNQQASSFGRLLKRVDLSHQPTASGPFVGPSGITSSKDHIWVSSVSSNAIIRLDKLSLEETLRIPVGQGPRDIEVLANGDLAVHCYQSLELWIIAPTGEKKQIIQLAEDPRPEAVSLGEKLFYQPGKLYATNHACDSCHVEGQNEGMIWRFGQDKYANVRPIQLLAATPPAHWDAYVSMPSTDGYAASSSIIAQPLSPDEAAGLTAFLESLAGAPRATGFTRLDGDYTEAALRGKALFEGRGGCTGCHTPPLYTAQRSVYGKSGQIADIPSLLGVYRHGVYFVDGRARSLAQAVDEITTLFGLSFSEPESRDLVAFLQQLTAKGAAPGAIFPDLFENEAVYPEISPWVEFFEPVDAKALQANDTRLAEALASYLQLERADGKLVPANIDLNKHRLTLRPNTSLEPGESYRFIIRQGLPFVGGGRLSADRIKSFTVASEAEKKLPSELTMTVTLQFGPNRQDLRFKLQNIADEGHAMGLVIVPMDAGMQQREQGWIRVDGDRLTMRPFALPFNTFSADWGLREVVANATNIEATITDRFSDGTLKKAVGNLELTSPSRNFSASFTIINTQSQIN